MRNRWNITLRKSLKITKTIHIAILTVVGFAAGSVETADGPILQKMFPSASTRHTSFLAWCLCKCENSHLAGMSLSDRDRGKMRHVRELTAFPKILTPLICSAFFRYNFIRYFTQINALCAIFGDI